jgi:hypothetical protein
MRNHCAAFAGTAGEGSREISSGGVGFETSLECAKLKMRIRLYIARERISALETAEHKRQRKLIQSAVEKLVATGAVHPGNLYGQFNVLEQLVKDPALCTLAITKKIFRAGPAQRKQTSS